MNPDEDHKGFMKGKFGDLAYTYFLYFGKCATKYSISSNDKHSSFKSMHSLRREMFQNSNYHHVMDIF